jgi:hypothetical protein
LVSIYNRVAQGTWWPRVKKSMLRQQRNFKGYLWHNVQAFVDKTAWCSGPFLDTPANRGKLREWE